MFASAYARFRLPKDDRWRVIVVAVNLNASLSRQDFRGQSGSSSKIRQMALQTRNNSNLRSYSKHSWSVASSGIFLSRISKNGRMVIPKLTITLFRYGKPNLDGYVVDVRLAPL